MWKEESIRLNIAERHRGTQKGGQALQMHWQRTETTSKNGEESLDA